MCELLPSNWTPFHELKVKNNNSNKVTNRNNTKFYLVLFSQHFKGKQRLTKILFKHDTELSAGYNYTAQDNIWSHSFQGSTVNRKVTQDL